MAAAPIIAEEPATRPTRRPGLFRSYARRTSARHAPFGHAIRPPQRCEHRARALSASVGRRLELQRARPITNWSSIGNMGVERKAAVRYVKIGSEAAGQRLDNFLIRLSKGVPKSHIYQVVRSGQVRINRGRAAADQRLSLGDEVRIPPMRVSVRSEARTRPAPSMLPVVFEDEQL